MSATLAPEKILKELARLWVSQGKQAESEGGGVLRACSMTLVVLSEQGEDPADLGETIAALMPEHPARAIVIRLSGAAGGGLSERVYAQCWMPFGQRRQICCEQIELVAPDAVLGELPPVVLPLAVADLPLMLWCRSSRLFGRQEFQAIAGMARKAIVDSAPVGRTALPRMAALAGAGMTLGDLSWTRLTRWRQMLSQVFENRDNLARLMSVRRVAVALEGDLEAAGYYLGAWVSNCLSDAGVAADVVREQPQAARMVALTMDGEGFHLELERQEDRMLISVNGLTQCTKLPMPNEYLLMREELGIVKSDPVFVRALDSAARLAYANE